MSTSAPRGERGERAGRGLAVAAEALYLANLLIAPGLAYALLVLLYLRHRREAPPLARGHLRQATLAGFWAGILLIVATTLIATLGGPSQPATWVAVILYFTTVHAALVLAGALGLARALSGQPFRYPLIGPRDHGD